MIMIKRKLTRHKLTELEQFIFSQALNEVKTKEDIDKMLENIKGTVLGLNKYAVEDLKKFAIRKVERLS